MTSSKKWTIAVDFDGVLHQYISPWVDATVIPDPPVPGAIEWLTEMSRHFRIVIHTCRFKQDNLDPADDERYPPQSLGKVARVVHAVQQWLRAHGLPGEVLAGLHFWTFPGKPTALVYVDDRGYRFRGDFPSRDDIHQRLRPWKTGQEKLSERNAALDRAVVAFRDGAIATAKEADELRAAVADLYSKLDTLYWDGVSSMPQRGADAEELNRLLCNHPAFQAVGNRREW